MIRICIGGNIIDLTELLDRLKAVRTTPELDAMLAEAGRIIKADTSGAGFYRVQTAIAKAKLRLAQV